MRALALLAILGLVATATSFAAPPGPPTMREFTLRAVAYACATQDDGVCLAYDGGAPGPTLDVNLGDAVLVTLVNDIAATLPPGAPAYLATTPVSFHVHGLALAVTSDGVPPHAGTAIPDSTVPPGGSRTYVARAAYPGVWHYHDHVIGADGQDGIARGLYGTVLVRSGAEERPQRTLDLHLLDAGANGGAGFSAAFPLSTFEIDVTGLGDLIWTVTLAAPDGARQSLVVAPGTSERFVVLAPQPGVYAWEARDDYGFKTDAGTVTLE